MSDPNTSPSPSPVATQDLAALVGILATLRGELATPEISPYLAGRLARRLARAGLLEDESNDPERLGQALDNLNHRLRYALGEYPSPQSDPPPAS